MLSVEAFQVRWMLVEPDAVAARLAGLLGGWVSGAISAREALTSSRPPVATFPARPASGSTPPRMADLTCATVALGNCDQISPAAPETYAHENEVPFHQR